MEPASIKQIGKYQVLDVLGRGGMGVVYRAQDKRMGRHVAIKTLTDTYLRDAGMLERFYQEAEKTGMLKHPNIVTVYDLGEQDGFPYIVMEYVEGQSLDRIIQERQPLALLYKLKIIEQVCHALGYAHQAGVVHRDVKPANVILQPDGHVKLLDFGIARLEKSGNAGGLTLAGNVIGTLPYMAPERLQGIAADGRSDIFATGVLMYQLVGGELPFSGEELVLVKKLLNEKQRPLAECIQGCPKLLDSIVDRSLAKNPQDRYGSAEEMASDLYLAAEELKREQVAQLIDDASRLSARQDYLGAREVLLRLLKIDTQHTDARRLLAEVQQRVSERQRVEQSRRLKEEANEAVSDKNYDRAVAALEQAIQLNAADRELFDLLAAAKVKKRTCEQVEAYLRQVDAARRTGDLTTAEAIMQKAMELDRLSSRVRAAYAGLAKEIQEAAERARVRELLEAARSELQARRYEPALELLRQAEHIDPADPELHTLLDAVDQGIRHRDRREVLDKLEALMATATTPEAIEEALRIAEEGLRRFPTDVTLLKCKGQLGRQLREETIRRRVQETVQQCRAKLDSAPDEALAIVRAELEQIPGNERLLALQARIEQRLATMTSETVRTRHLQDARDALKAADYSKAASILESCPNEIASPEMRDLLEYARQEAQQAERRMLVAQTIACAHASLRDAKYDEAVQLLERLQPQEEEGEAKELLEEARRQRDSSPRQVSETLRAAEAFFRAGLYGETLEMLSADPCFGRTRAGETLLAWAGAKRGTEAELLARMGRGYAALDGPCVAPDWKDTCSALDAFGEDRVLTHLRTQLSSRIRERASRSITAELRNIRAELRSGETAEAAKLIAEGENIAQYASAERQAEWRAVADEVAHEMKKRLFRRATHR